MFKKSTIFLLFYNVIIVELVFPYQNNIEYDYSDQRHEAYFPLQPPASDLGNVYTNVNDIDTMKRKMKFNSDLENWSGKWFPNSHSQSTIAPDINLLDSNNHISHGVLMGIHSNCDDGKTKLEVDWDNSPINYTCYSQQITPSYDINPVWYCEYISPFYKALHRCMNQTIEYNDNIPLFGSHRPVWPVYGEYKFLPRQRWIHSLEHGAVVMLYHPCANPREVQLLKDLVTQCLRRHVITRHSLMDIERPLALVTWGCRLTMSYVDKKLVMRFIREKALHGAEKIVRDGDYIDGLVAHAVIVSDEADSQLCPNLE